jgi:hypothetical protein
MNAFSTVAIVISLLLSLAGLLLVARVAGRVQELRDQFARLPVSRLESLAASQAELAETMETLANRVKMQRVRTAAMHATKLGSGGEPDARTDPEGWRAWKNAQLRTGVVN